MKEIPLTKGMIASVSDEDYEFLSQWKWSASLESRGTKWYAIRWSRKSEHGPYKRFKIRMHRVIADRMLNGTLDNSQVVDHSDDNSLNNQRNNLEPVSQTENMDRCAGWKGGRQFKENKALNFSTPQISLTVCNPSPICPLVESIDNDATP